MIANESFEFVAFLNIVLKGKLVVQYSFDLSLGLLFILHCECMEDVCCLSGMKMY